MVEKLSSHDICKIIRVAREFGVHKLTVENLSIEMCVDSYSLKNTPAIKVSKEEEAAAVKMATESTQALAETDKGAELEELIFTDPYEYERRIGLGEIHEKHSKAT